jgi:hypothetical protein
MKNRNLSSLSSITLALTVAFSAVLLSGCGDEKSAAKPDTRTEAQKKSDEVYNPTPEQKAKKEAERQAQIDANKPRSVEFSNPGISEDSNYTDIGKIMVAFKIYNARRNWEETPDDIADSSAVRLNYDGIDRKLFALEQKRDQTSDSFKKADIAKEMATVVNSISEPYKNVQLVKISFNSDTIDLRAYDFTLKGFKVSEAFFSDKVRLSKDDKQNTSDGNGLKGAPSSAAVSFTPLDYYVGLFNTTNNTFIKVDDEQVARKIEAARNTAKVDVYGFVQSIQRTRVNGADQKNRYVYIQPQRIDIRDGKTNEILFSKII